jgi:EAL domain-containing protein (putative c-di-GMP-specific phosphodiesterase class I)
MVESRENGEIVRTIVKLAQNLKMKVIAEGIETVEQITKLKQLGCEYGQGYFISAPMDANAAALFIKTHSEKLPLIPSETTLMGAELNM